ncbi:tail fiber domain-containing protein [Shewanella youngdeokensis]|uniref:Tail fiber domain-containing protein n=1 Tax=Shewanella youngdeokensis TaxID=2999068 RepID=A0ABZ0K180_9GAMM|nr:tail fiber domain-containing protein [Shewanella sp. DAU334]
MKNKITLSMAALSLLISSNLYAAQVFQDDVIVTGSLCAGFDCVNGESFNFDTLRLKENNLRIKFEDTSASSSFPSNDWQITINDSANGGANKFSIDDIDSSKTPFTIEAGAPNHSVYVDDGGRVGIGTSTPLFNLHAVSGNTPTLRLEQNSSSGFTAQAWDIGSNETNFFVRDASNGSALPFKIRPSAPNNSLYIDTDGDIGLGTATPAADLHVVSNNSNALLIGNNQADYTMLVNGDGKTHIQGDNLDTDATTCGSNGSLNIACGRFTPLATIEENNSSATGRTLLALKNNAPGWLSMEDTTKNTVWLISNAPTGLNFVLHDKTTDTITTPLIIENNGDITVAGVVNQSSSRLLKDNISEVNYDSILKSIDALAINHWSYIKDKGKVTHIGPMAQDFYSAFNVGSDEKHISSVDSNGISLAAIKALYQKVKDLESKITELENK